MFLKKSKFSLPLHPIRRPAPPKGLTENALVCRGGFQTRLLIETDPVPGGAWSGKKGWGHATQPRIGYVVGEREVGVPVQI